MEEFNVGDSGFSIFTEDVKVSSIVFILRNIINDGDSSKFDVSAQVSNRGVDE